MGFVHLGGCFTNAGNPGAICQEVASAFLECFPRAFPGNCKKSHMFCCRCRSQISHAAGIRVQGTKTTKGVVEPLLTGAGGSWAEWGGGVAGALP